MKEHSFSDKIKRIAYGGDYNPEQWPEEIWEEDMRLFKEAGIDTVTLNVFSWAALQKSEYEYDFSKLDQIMDCVTKNGMNVILATSTAAHPAWMAKNHPDILRVTYNGMKRKYGHRHNCCPNSPTFLKYAPRLAGKLAERYAGYENLIAWHISNEYDAHCYCKNCEAEFRKWLKRKYGTIEEVNRAWCTSFWSHTFYDFDEIVVPNRLTEEFSDIETSFQGISLDYRRFMSDSMLNECALEAKAIKQYTPNVPVTTNFMHFFKELDLRKWSEVLDFTSWDSYPFYDEDRADVSMWHDYMRSLKGGQPHLLMEQTPNVTNWQVYNYIRRPGVVRLWSWRSVAHGADGVLFFQLRRSQGAMEKMHGAVIDHVGTGNTRSFREISAIGHEFDSLGDTLLGARTDAKAAVIFDYDNYWASELCCGPSRDPEYKSYRNEVMRYYKALNALNISTDVIGEEDDFGKYKLLVAPILYMVKPGVKERIEAFVKAGGTFVASAFSGIVNETDLVYLGGHPGPLKEVLGIWVEEIDCLPPEVKNSFVYGGKRYEAKQYFDIISALDPTCRSLASYEKDFYAGKPAVTKNNFGQGFAYYVATRSSDDFYFDFLGYLAKEAGVPQVHPAVPGLEATVRTNENGRFLFFLNHSDNSIVITAPEAGRALLEDDSVAAGDEITLQAKDVLILQCN